MRLRKGDPIPSDNTRTSTIDSRMLQALMDAQDSIDLNALEREQLKRESMYYEDPAGLPTQDPVFDLLGLAGPKVVAAFGRRALGEAGEAVAKQAAKGRQPYMRMKSDLELNKRELDSLLKRYEEAYENLEYHKDWLSKYGPVSKSDDFILSRREAALRDAEKMMEDYGLDIVSLKKKINELAGN